MKDPIPQKGQKFFFQNFTINYIKKTRNLNGNVWALYLPIKRKGVRIKCGQDHQTGHVVGTDWLECDNYDVKSDQPAIRHNFLCTAEYGDWNMFRR